MATPAANARYAGATIGGRYRLDKLLGEGGMGAVYAATMLDRQGRVAVKLLHDEMAASATVVERFLAEGDVCRKLDHAGILRVHDVGHQNGVPYLVMELLEGRALVDYTEHQQRLPLNFAVTVCAGVLHALDYAHAQGIVHRDLKPENVFLVPTPDGQYHTKILDFGIARCIDAAGGQRRRTATGVLLGTPGYMSPEQVKAARNVDHRTDLWAVGVMFYEMVAGATAFPSDGDDPNNIWGLISAVLTKEPVPLSVYDPHLAPFDHFIKRALAKDIDKRYASAREMCEDMLRIARGEVRTSDPQSPNASAFTKEQRAVPINSRGDLPMIPAVQQAQPVAQAGGTLGSTQYAPPSNLPVGSQPQGPAGIHSTMPSGAGRDQTPSPQQAALDNLNGTIPMDPNGQQPQRSSFNPYPTGQRAMTPQNELAQTALAPDVQRPSAPRYGTSPSGFAPQNPPRPSGPSPLIPQNNGAASREDDGGGGGSVLPWVLLGIVLVAALGGAVVWVLH